MANKQTFTGIVSQVSAKDWKDNKTGENIVLHSFQLAEAGNKWFRTGTNALVKDGQTVRFLADAQTSKVDPDTVEVVAAAVVVAPKVVVPTNRVEQPISNSRNSGRSGLSRDDYWANKEKRDVEKDARYQAVDIPRMTFCTSQDAAVALVTAALQNDILPVAGSKKADKLDTLLAYVDEVTDRFFAQRMATSVKAGESAVLAAELLQEPGIE